MKRERDGNRTNDARRRHRSPPRSTHRSGIRIVPRRRARTRCERRTVRRNLRSSRARDRRVGWCFLQYESWGSHDDIKAKDLSTFHEEIDAAADILRERGCDRVFAVGKSLGGGLLFTHGLSAFEGAVLWAPAAYLGADAEGMVVLDSEGVAAISTPVALVQGTDDEVVDLDDARWIVDRLADAELVAIEGAGHSYRADRHRETVLEETMAFLREHR
ncbi:alpha/beta hydrolase [Halosolutus gelatinilyticus]|uniref:alpha/beta hydrolase n=1 Tax=Halosolutus gelatinilyticus TaxID=2931975 RepID=UPI001FF5FFE5|nr:dienelactone hydrolase family protein [Halosolutus gelatinilyticus]